MTNRLSHSLRSDARDNRERILAVARTTFAEQGLDVAMREIARRAEVGPATLYRHFPTKEALVTEAFSEQMTACAALVDEGLADPDPWHGFCRVVEKMCEMHAWDRGFTAAFVSAFPRAIDFAADREQAWGKVAELARRAKETGELRPDFVLDDLIMVLMANGGIRTSSPATAVAASRRFAALLIQGMRAQPAIPALPPAVRLPLTVMTWRRTSGSSARYGSPADR
ncbi:TetR/AcrR family transcriptional regulator [Streptomyces acidiscabies]|uniref:TetR/AcrR family transcriptional regulator n=1 Tax=Streptomyces acidiscabies TaxID=42234 RepID=UPI0038F5DF57